MSRGADMLRALRGSRKQTAAPVPAVRYATSPLLASKTPPWRIKFLTGAIGLAFAVLLGRAAWIQIIHNDFYLQKGVVNVVRRIELVAKRGRILDRNGELLASSVPAASIWVVPKEFDATPAQQRQLLRLLDMSAQEFRKRMGSNPNFVWLRRQVEDDVAVQIAQLKLKGLREIKEWRRQYPESEAAAHIVGFTSVEEKGQEGIELAYNKELSGRDGQRFVIKDRLGHVIESVGDVVPAVDGRDIRLSIDAKVQTNAYQRIRDAVALHKAKAGSVVVLDAQTGEVLALANVPSYTPSNRRNLTGAQLRNRALTDTFEPGSTMKPLVIAQAMELGRVQADSIIPTYPGRMQLDGATIMDAHPHGDMSVEQVIQKSSNVGTVKIAMRLQPREMWDTFSAAGLGHKPQIGFPGAVTGRLRPYKSWRRIEQATMSYGYGLSASLLQLAQAYTVFASDGELVPMSLIKREMAAESPDEDDSPRAALEGGAGRVPLAFKAAAGHAHAAPPIEPMAYVRGIRVFSPEVARSVRKMLAMVCADGGTAPLAQTAGYSVGGKTGTAHKQEGKGYAGNKYRSWFVGIAPISNPRIVVAVMVDEPGNGVYYGGAVAAPVFSQVVQQTLNRLGVMPDMDVQLRITASQAVPESFQ